MTTAKHPSNQLGISAKSINQPYLARVAAVSGDIVGKFRKVDMTRQAGTILYDPTKTAAEQHRVCWCHRGIANPSDIAHLYRRDSEKSARLHGVTTCTSVWACPTCSNKICAVRQAELADGMKNWVNQGSYSTWTPGAKSGRVVCSNHVFLMTLTFPHERDQPLAEMLQAFTKAKALFKNSKTYKRVLAKGIRRGSVSSLEVTLGENGWHPHQHDLVFANSDAFGQVTEGERGKLISALIDELKSAWYTALHKAGLCEQNQLSDVLAHGLDIRGGQYAAEYIAKFGQDQRWGMSREITMHAAKVGTDNKGAHPFQLLAWAMTGDTLAGAQFREYAMAFEGKRMLTWSRGLKKELTGVDEITDDEANERELPDETRVGKITGADLAVLQSRWLLGEFLAYVAEFCADPETAQSEIDAYIAAARELNRIGRGTIKRKIHCKGFVHVDAESEYEHA